MSFFFISFFLNGTFSKQKTNLIMDDYASSLFFVCFFCQSWHRFLSNLVIIFFLWLRSQHWTMKENQEVFTNVWPESISYFFITLSNSIKKSPFSKCKTVFSVQNISWILKIKFNENKMIGFWVLTQKLSPFFIQSKLLCIYFSCMNW